MRDSFAGKIDRLLNKRQTIKAMFDCFEDLGTVAID